MRVPLDTCELVPCPVADAEKPALMNDHVTNPEQSSLKGLIHPMRYRLGIQIGDGRLFLIDCISNQISIISTLIFK